MEKRALVAVVLSIAVIASWPLVLNFFFPQPSAHRTTTLGGASSVASAPAGEAVPEQIAAPAALQPGEPAEPVSPAPVGTTPVQAARKEEFRVVTSTQDVRLTNEGGRVTWWRLVRYTKDGAIPVDLLPDQARASGLLPLQIEVDGEPETTKALAGALHTHEVTELVAGDPSALGPGKRVTFSYADGHGLAVRKTLELPDAGYVGRVSFEVTRGGKPLLSRLVWAAGLAEPSEDGTTKYGHVQGEAVLLEGSEVLHLAPASVEMPAVFGAPTRPPLRWAGLNSTYFASLLLPQQPESPITVTIEPHRLTGVEGATAEKPFHLLTAGVTALGAGSFRIFVGPKDYYLLKSLGNELERVIDFSRYPIIYPCTKAMFLALTWVNSYVGNYGWSIIILTFLVRLAFFPIMYRSSITMRQTSKKMSKVQPRVKAIQDRYRKIKKTMETQRQMNEEIMALYKKEGINPMANLGGCLPLLLQMPIFIGFYNLLAVTIEMRQAPFILWIQDLSRRDPLTIPVLPLLMGASWLVQQWMTSASIPDPTQRRIMMLMPVMFTFFMMNMPSGLVLYWLTSNLLGMAQQYVTNRRADRLDEEAHGRPRATPKSRRAEDGQTA